MHSSHSDLVQPWAATPVAQEYLGWPGGTDNPDERTDLDQPVRVDVRVDDEATTVRPPLPALLAASAVQASDAPERPSIRGFAASLRGKVGKYELVAKLGRGAFGVVFTARDPSLDRDVAIKILRPSHLTNPEIIKRFLQEARATARIGHPGIVTIHDCGRVDTTAGTTAFIAMELLTGESLTARLTRTERFAPVAAIEIARQVASALEAAHRADVLHRDLKPDNIYLVPDPAMPEGERIKVLDFGLAKLGEGTHTEAQLVFGTPRYMSPEQCRSTTQVDHRSDIYALGCILFELVTGRSPFEGDLRTLIERHQRSTAPRASSLVPDVLPALDDLIADMLAKDPMNRPQTMGAVQRGLAVALEDQPPAAPDTASIPTEVPIGEPLDLYPTAEPAQLFARPSAPQLPSPRSRRPSTHPRPSSNALPQLARPSSVSVILDSLDDSGLAPSRAFVPAAPPARPSLTAIGTPIGTPHLPAPPAAFIPSTPIAATPSPLPHGHSSGVLIIPPTAGAGASPEAASPLAVGTPRARWHRIALGALCVVIGAVGGAIAWLSLAH